MSDQFSTLSVVRPSNARVFEAAEYIATELYRMRIAVMQYKEKFGQVRVYTRFGWYDGTDLVRPSYSSIPAFGFLNYLLRTSLVSAIVCRLSLVAEPLQQKWYKRTYKKALAKFPDLRYAILAGADWPELLGGL